MIYPWWQGWRRAGRATVIGLVCLIGLTCSGFLWGGGSCVAAPLSVVFISPGKFDEPFWRSVERFMQPAARQLDMQLDVLYAERNHVKAVALLSEVLAREHRPDYLIVVNEKRVGPTMLKMADAAHVPVLLAFSSLDPDEAAQIGTPRHPLRFWLGSVMPDALDAGRRSALGLIEATRNAGLKAPDGKYHVVMIAGDRVTPTSVQRNQGAQQAFEAMPDVVLDQVAYGDWERSRAQVQVASLGKRYPFVSAYWCASDLMAFGALDALYSANRAPGRDVMVSAFNNSPNTLQARVDGRFATLAAGHFTLGGWALVMLYDHHHGRDFADLGLDQKWTLFSTLDAREAGVMLNRYRDEDFSSIDFKSYSRVLHPAQQVYDFDFARLLK